MLKDFFKSRKEKAAPATPAAAPAPSGKTPSAAAIAQFIADARDGELGGVIAYLDKYGDANVDLPGTDGYTALMKAARKSNIQICRTLAARGADVNAADKDGWTVLRTAVSVGTHDACLALIELGAEVNKPNKELWTPLMAAARDGNERIVTLLLSKGADPLLRNNANQTALDAAEEAAAAGRGKHGPVIAALRAGMAKEADRQNRAELARREKAADEVTKGFNDGVDRPVTVMKPMKFKA